MWALISACRSRTFRHHPHRVHLYTLIMSPRMIKCPRSNGQAQGSYKFENWNCLIITNVHMFDFLFPGFHYSFLSSELPWAKCYFLPFCCGILSYSFLCAKLLSLIAQNCVATWYFILPESSCMQSTSIPIIAYATINSISNSISYNSRTVIRLRIKHS